MIVLDTNVVSEAMRPRPDPGVMAWLGRQAGSTLYISSITLAELLFGIGTLPAGKRQERLAEALAGLLKIFEGRILNFDTEAAQSYAAVAVKAKKSGLGFPVADGFIAAIASAHGYAVATRDTTAFDAAGLEVINPWLYEKTA